MAEIRHLENRHDVIFLCWGWSYLDKISQTGAEWHVDCGDVVKIETRCRITIWRTFGRIPWHVIPHCRVLPLGEFTVMILEPHARLQGVIISSAILKIVFCHILFFFKCSVGFDERRLLYRLRYTCFNKLCCQLRPIIKMDGACCVCKQ